MSSQLFRTICCMLITLAGVISLTFFLTKEHYENDNEHTRPLLVSSPTPSTSPTPDSIISIPTPTPVITPIPVNTTRPSNPDVSIFQDECIGPNNNRVLIVYDSNPNNEYSYLSELYAVNAKNLVSHFRDSDAIHISNYTSMCGYGHVMYIGYGFFRHPKLNRFVDDVLSNMDNIPIMWLGTNIWNMVNTTTENLFGFRYIQRRADVRQIFYKGQWVPRNFRGDSVSEMEIFNHHKVDMLSYAYLENKNIPWALRSNGKFMYISEIPFSYIDFDDRYLVFVDLLFEFFNVNINRNRALVRLEDIGPHYNVDAFLNTVNFLKNNSVPFTFGVFPIYVSRTRTLRLKDRPEMANAIKYATENGGTIIFHGTTHQYKNISNPYQGESGDDFEFYLTHVDPDTQGVVYDSPIPEDSVEWVEDILRRGFEEFDLAGVPRPIVFEFPHYIGSDLDYRVIAKHFKYRFDRGTHYLGSLHNTTIDYNGFKTIQHFNPFIIKDIYGSIVFPENLGNYIRTAINNNKNRYSEDIVHSARLNKNVIRDSIASFFYHPFLGTQYIEEIVRGIKGLGYTFVSVFDLVNDFH